MDGNQTMNDLEPLIITLKKLGEKPTAIQLLKTLEKHAVGFEQYDMLAKCFFKIKEYEAAIRNSEKTIILATSGRHLYISRMNLINVYNHANYPEKAMDLIEMVEITNPQDIDNKLEKAFSFFLLNEKDKAEEILRTELNNPNITEEIRTKIKFNLGTYELYRDKFQEGLSKFLFEGRKMDLWKKPLLPFKFWNGVEDIKGSKLIILAEAGIGDEFINVRFMNHLRKLGIDPIWYTERSDLCRIFNDNGYPCVTNVKNFSEVYWTHSMDIPIYLGLQYKDLWNGPYLKANSNFIAKHKLNNDKFKIGLRWQGNPEYDQDLHRSIPIKDIIKTINFDCELHSLQKDNGLEEIENLNIVDHSKDMETFEDTLGIIHNLDLVITSCTSVAHASAAMGKKTIIFTPISAYYVWSHSMDQSPWYGDNVKLLRQKKPRVWNEPVKELEDYLKNIIK